MRRINVKTESLDVVPANGLIEIFQPAGNFNNSKPQYISAGAVNSAVLVTPGAGIVAAGGQVYSSVVQEGDFKKTTLLVDITGLKSSTTLLDIIGHLGADLVQGGDFTDGDDWDLDSGITIAGGVLNAGGAQGPSALATNISTHYDVGSYYEVEFTVSNWVAGSVHYKLGTTSGTARSSNATFTQRHHCAGSSRLRFSFTDEFDGDVDNVSVKLCAPVYLTQFTDAINGALFRGVVTCLTAPVGGELDIDIYSAVEGTGYESEPIASLDETELLASAADWTKDINVLFEIPVMPADGEYLYLINGDLGTPGTYTDGQLLFEFWGT